MDHHWQTGEVCLRPGPNGLSVVVAPATVLTLPSTVPAARPIRRVLGVLVLALGLWSLPRVSLAAVFSPAKILDDTNAVRFAQDLPPVQLDARLEQAAQAKAADMFQAQYFGHTSPTGIEPWSWFTQSGYAFTYAGENLAIDYAEPSSIVADWMRSAGHRANIINPKFHDVGIAVMAGMMAGRETIVVVQFFGNRGLATTPPSTVRPVRAQTVHPPQPAPVEPTAVRPTPVQTPPSQVGVTVPPLLASDFQKPAETTKVIHSLEPPMAVTWEPNPALTRLLFSTILACLSVVVGAACIQTFLGEQLTPSLGWPHTEIATISGS